ncbi:hypothetical protein J8Z82_09945 [Yersinia enterocolitica]|uniref:hypothetical protein n=1 Tax=Yersinia enterocolitica TaxID=630 RepID=UPI001C8DA890|nr:hypothetical protein [Yersinia enterocolitica]MBX9489520.1 hypothetical protein [Yersinia enterocolitica]MBX9492112.1 hypothetical protein [Yersinia enterocolitica]
MASLALAALSPAVNALAYGQLPVLTWTLPSDTSEARNPLAGFGGDWRWYYRRLAECG